MSQPSMEEAANIRDVAARHAYVFDNGLSSPDFFDVEKRMASEEFRLIVSHSDRDNSVLEVGCFTGLNLLGLEILGYTNLIGMDFVEGALKWCREQSQGLVKTIHETFPLLGKHDIPHDFTFDRFVCFDVLEHQLNVGSFLTGVQRLLKPTGRALFLVPVGREFYDCGHVAFFPDAECLRNVLDYVFEVEEIFELKTCKKLFASCRRRP